METLLLAEYKAWKGPTWKGRDDDMQRALERFTAFCGKADPAQVTQADAFAWARHLASETNKHGEPRSHADQSRQLGHVAATFAALKRRGHIPYSPFSGVGAAVAAPMVRDPAEMVLTTAQLVALRDAVDRMRFGGKRHQHARWAFHVLAHTGMRASELFGIKREHVTLEDGVCVLRIVDGKSPSARRRVPLQAPLTGFYAFAQSQPDEHVFSPFPDGSRGRAHWLSTSWGALAKEAGVPDSTPYMLRHTVCSLLAATALPQRLQDALTGHSTDIKGKHYVSFPLSVLVDAMAHVKPFEPRA